MKKQLGRDCDGHSEWPMLESTFECLEGQSAEASEPEGKRWESRSEVHIWLLRAVSFRVVRHSQLFLTFGLSQILTPTARCRLHLYSWVLFRFNLFTHGFISYFLL